VFGFDFNPAADRIRVVSNTGQNLRLHPDTGAVVDGDAAVDGVQPDPSLRYAWGDVNARRQARHCRCRLYLQPQRQQDHHQLRDRPRAGCAGDAGLEARARQPVVSPNAGRLSTVGPLNAGPFERASFDIADVDNAAFAVLTPAGARRSVLYRIDLATGAATRVGPVAGDAPVAGMAIEP
jgi:hypothetical protein